MTLPVKLPGNTRSMMPLKRNMRGLTDEDLEVLEEFDSRIILIGDGVSEAEVYAAELEIL